MKFIILKLIYILALISSVVMVSCSDEPLGFDGVIPDGEGNLTATITFNPASEATLGNTRTSGNAIKTINNLNVLVYNTKNELLKSYYHDASDNSQLLNYQEKTYTVKDGDHYDGNNAHAAETTTPQATFTIPGLDYGRYYIYAVANMGDLSKNPIYSEDVKTVDGLKAIQVTWNQNDIAANAQMFGYFTPAGNMESAGFDAKQIEFKPGKQEIHAWLKRLASKVTVAFDGSGLNQNVWIYIRNVTVRDIPKTCVLGEVNSPKNAEGLLNSLSTPYPKPNINTKSEAIANSRLEYDSKGVITDPNQHTGSAKTDGLAITNSIRSAYPANSHAESAPSLFFYENNQGDYSDKPTAEKDKYDKIQHPRNDNDPDAVGTAIRDSENDNDFKDRVPYGTYIEVEAYYISTNPKNVSEGSIKYRFMLGKDVTYNYDAQRNYHFKLTLGFNGWANQPDWHIDYEEPEPGLQVPPVVRVSYLYHQKSEMPIKILGNCTSLEVDIIENNWAPFDPTSSDGVPAQTVISTPTEYEFKWNRDAYVQYYKPTWKNRTDNNAYFGFLALNMPEKLETTVVDMEFGKGETAQTALKSYYNTNKEGYRTFTSSDLTIGHHDGTSINAYDVNKVVDNLDNEVPNQKTVMLPLWTRAKSMITGSGFSGNNPYEGYERKARLKIVGHFSVNGEDIPIEKEVTVYQVKRIVNPSGVWRAHDRNDAFHVILKESINANGRSDFRDFASEGEWTAYIDDATNDGTFSLSTSSTTNGYAENGEIHGYTGSLIDFNINFNGAVSENESKCAIVKVLYHGNQCMHKILVRKGYNAPITMGGNQWSSFSVYKALWRKYEGTPQVDGLNDTYNVELTKNPLALGSMFRRGKQTSGILVKNNDQPNLFEFLPPNGANFVIANQNETTKTWNGIGFRDDVFTSTTRTGTTTKEYFNSYGTQGAQNYNMGTFYVGSQKYRVPTYDDFTKLTADADFVFGVVYGSAATEAAYTADEAYGFIDYGNSGLFDSKLGMRGVMVYNKSNGDQIFFPVGKRGSGARRMFNVQNSNYYGVLRYPDVYNVLSLSASDNNRYRPVPYNLPIAPGTIYWIDVYKKDAHPEVSNTNANLPGRGCLGWDLNYFNYDFNAYTANNYRDACQIKLILAK